MHIGVGDYYSLSTGGYTRHHNVEVIGVDSRQPYHAPYVPSYSSEKDIQSSVIKEEEEVQYETGDVQSVESPRQRLYNTTRHKDRQEVTSIYTQGGHSQTQRRQLVHSCISNKKGTPKTGLKKRLDQLQGNNVTSQESSCGEDLYLQLQKQKQMRMELQRSYKQLLSEMDRNEKHLQIDIGSGFGQRQFSKRTLKEERVTPIEFSEPSSLKTSKVRNCSMRVAEPHKLSYEDTHDLQAYQIQQNEEVSESDGSINYRRKKMMTEESVSEYFDEQREFQERMIGLIEHLHSKVEEIDSFLFEKQKEKEQDDVRRRMNDQEAEIVRMRNQNERLRQGKRQKEMSEEQMSEGQDILKKLSPNSLYFFCLLLMAIVAIA